MRRRRSVGVRIIGIIVVSSEVWVGDSSAEGKRGRHYGRYRGVGRCCR